MIHRCNLALTLALALGALLTLAAPAVHADGLAPTQQNRLFGFEELTGSWFGSTEVGTTFLLSFHPDKTYTVSFTLPGVGAADGHGAWRRTGLETFALTDLSLVVNGDNELILIQKTQADVEVDGDEAEFELLVTLTLPDGTPVDALTVLAEASRIEVEPVP